MPAVRAPRVSVAAVAALAVLVTLVAIAFAPWLRPDLYWEDVADAPNHLIRIYAIGAELAAGNWYPRWLPDLYLGYGYPLLNFYAPATYYVAAALRGVGASVYAALQWSGVLAAAVGSLGAAALARSLTRSTRAALLAGAIFLLSPYPFLTNLYVRAAIPEALALALLPWLLLAARAVVLGRRWGPVALALVVALLALTHNVSALVFLPLTLLWLGAQEVIVTGGRLRTTTLRTTAVSVGLGMALSAFFWLPAVLETRHVQLELAGDRGGIYDPLSWLFDPLRAGVSYTQPLFDYTALGRAAAERLSPWQVGLWLLALIGGASRVRRPTARLALLCAALCAAFWFMNTRWSAPVWEAIPPSRLVQFPWRLYGPLALFLGLAVSLVTAPATSVRIVDAARGRAWPGAAILACAALLTVGLAVGALSNRPARFSDAPPPHDVDERDLAVKEYNRYGAGTTSGGEFLPRTVSWAVEGSSRRGIKIYEDAYPQAGWQAGLVRVLEGRATVTSIYRDSLGIAADLGVEASARVGIHQLAFPGWRGYLDGAPVTLSIARYDPADAMLGFMVVDVPPGTHRVEVRFAPTRVRHVANAVSAAGTVLLVALAASIAGRPLPTWLVIAGATAAALLTVGAAELRARPGATVQPAAARVAFDVIGALERGQAATRAPTGTGPGFLAPYLDRQYESVRGEERRWLYMHPPTEAAVRLHVPPDAYFQAGLALDPATWTAATGDGVRFIVEVDTPSGRNELLNRPVNPRARTEEQTWQDVWIPLLDLAGQDVTLRLRTDAADDPTFDWAGWSNPQVVIYRAARPQPGAPHKW